ncbi:WD repeat-containing protein 35, partial [Cichlidogyrus casuarinus]
MFTFLSKKITVPNDATVNCLAWSKSYGYIACGCDQGLLKVLRFDGTKGETATSGTRSSTLSLNKSLEGHNNPVVTAVWNEKHEKLTTSDKSGLVIVWAIDKDNWYQEMVNSQKKVMVSSMKWSSSGRHICIAYSDGSVIVGLVDGTRAWGKDLGHGPLTAIAWSPNGSLILFGLANGEVLKYDQYGNCKGKVSIFCLDKKQTNAKLCGIEWSSKLTILYVNGRLQLGTDPEDSDPVLLDAGIEIRNSCWNHDGSLLVVAGVQKNPNTSDLVVLQFYASNGDHLRTMPIPGNSISACTFEGFGSLRLAVGVDSFVYLANLRPSFQYGFMHLNSTLVFLTNSLYASSETSSQRIIFWNLREKKARVVNMFNLRGIAAGAEYCCIAVSDPKIHAPCELRILNSLGISIDQRTVNFVPVCIAMADRLLIACSRSEFFFWMITDSKIASYFGPSKVSKNLEKYVQLSEIVDKDAAIVCAAISRNVDKSAVKFLFLGLEHGLIVKLRLPDLTLMESVQCCDNKPVKIAPNCNGNIVAVIDELGQLHLKRCDKDEPIEDFDKLVADTFPRKDAWDVLFAIDEPLQLASMEKGRLYLFDNLSSEDPIHSSDYLMHFEGLTLTAIKLDNIYSNNGHVDPTDRSTHVSKMLRRAQTLAGTKSLEELQAYAEANVHPKIWNCLAEAALEQGDLTLAEMSFVHLQNYAGIKMVEKWKQIQSPALVKAFIKAYLGHYDEAEKIFLEADRADLAVDMRKTEGNW